MDRILLKNVDVPNIHDIDVYMAHGGYISLDKAFAMDPKDVLEEVKRSGLRGRGGAWFPAGMKWQFCVEVPKFPKYLIANADEGEPGTFKDRPFLETDPHQLIEGMIVSAYAIGASGGYIYLRGEYPDGYRTLNTAIKQAYDRNLLGKNIKGTDFSFDLTVHRGAGAYICGEASALIESLEGKRGQFRVRPPYMATHGAFAMPTVVNNVETLVNVSHIINHGADWWGSIGTKESPGPKVFGISGHLNRPGLYEEAMGVTLRELIYERGGGIRGGKKLKGVIPGGVSTSMLTPDFLDMKMDVKSLQDAGSAIGSGALMVMDEDTCIVHIVWRAMAFFQHESCGRCTPCREGTDWMLQILARMENGGGRMEDLDILADVCHTIHHNCFCPLGEGAVMPVLSSLKYFRHEYEEHIKAGKCPKGLRARVRH
ncbi:MAG: NADH-quinone oxidoreductase subunit NuoF [Nitrospirae bacterium]|nr:NADH-quinone oxidoreductase subunit NuoF [Nitrospirota bacterium]MBI5696679.1 NADH-quinone oxidoreductase subunit NuoF [Nitrospirota bacterium]